MRIICALCQGPVANTTVWREPGEGKTTIIAECHGQTDTMSITDHDICRLGPDAVRQMENGVGIAFAPKPAAGLLA